MQKSIVQTSRLPPYKPFLSKDKARLLANAFINCQFLCTPLMWMFASKSSITKIFKIYFKALQIVHNVHELLAVSNDVSVNRKHLCILAIEVYKSLMKNIIQILRGISTL